MYLLLGALMAVPFIFVLIYTEHKLALNSNIFPKDPSLPWWTGDRRN